MTNAPKEIVQNDKNLVKELTIEEENQEGQMRQLICLK